MPCGHTERQSCIMKGARRSGDARDWPRTFDLAICCPWKAARCFGMCGTAPFVAERCSQASWREILGANWAQQPHVGERARNVFGVGRAVCCMCGVRNGGGERGPSCFVPTVMCAGCVAEFRRSGRAKENGDALLPRSARNTPRRARHGREEAACSLDNHVCRVFLCSRPGALTPGRRASLSASG